MKRNGKNTKKHDIFSQSLFVSFRVKTTSHLKSKGGSLDVGRVREAQPQIQGGPSEPILVINGVIHGAFVSVKQTPGKPTDFRPFIGVIISPLITSRGPPCSCEWNQKTPIHDQRLACPHRPIFALKPSETKKNIATWKLISIQILTFESLWECHLTARTPFVHRVFVVFAFGLTSPLDKTNMF